MRNPLETVSLSSQLSFLSTAELPMAKIQASIPNAGTLGDIETNMLECEGWGVILPTEQVFGVLKLHTPIYTYNVHLLSKKIYIYVNI